MGLSEITWGYVGSGEIVGGQITDIPGLGIINDNDITPVIWGSVKSCWFIGGSCGVIGGHVGTFEVMWQWGYTGSLSNCVHSFTNKQRMCLKSWDVCHVSSHVSVSSITIAAAVISN